MIGWLILLAFALLFAILAWLRGRPTEWLFPSDVFFILIVLIAGIVPFLNLYAVSPLFRGAHYSDYTVRTTVISLTLMFLSLGLVWMLRPPITPELLHRPHDERERREHARRASPILWTGAVIFAAVSLAMFAYGPYIAYKSEVARFLTGQITAVEYQEARRILFADDPVIEGVMGRLRYGVLPVLFVGLTILAVRRLGIVTGFAIAAFFFVLGPASMSKAPMFVYLLYFAIAVIWVKDMAWPLRARNVLVVLAFVIPATLVLLSGVYYLQYGGRYSGAGSLLDALSLSYFRVFVATYDGLLRYITVFPNGGVGVSGIPAVAALFGEPQRNLDLEIAYFFIGMRGQYTSFPTIFIGNAYASFGYVGVAVYSFIVAWALWLIDKAIVSVRNRDLRIVLFSCATVNALFFSLLAAPTALLTYGNAILPLLVLAVDRMIVPVKRARKPIYR